MSTYFTGDLRSLQPLDEATSPFQAAGIWWARSLLHAHFDMGGNAVNGIGKSEVEYRDALVKKRKVIQEVIGGFANALAFLSEKKGINHINVVDAAHPILLEAAQLAVLPAQEEGTFPNRSYSWIIDNVVLAKMGQRGLEKQVWPVE